MSDSHDAPPPASEGTARSQASLSPPYAELELKALEGHVIEAIRQVYDPELPLNVYDLGLIYEIKIEPSGETHILMTLTNPACPVAGTLPKEVEAAAQRVQGLGEVKVELTWSPPWSKDRLSPEHQLLFSTFM